MTIHPGPLHAGTVATYDDHRMAMSFSLLGLRVPGIVIADPGCTAKTYPDYFGTWIAFANQQDDLLVGRTILSVFIELPARTDRIVRPTKSSSPSIKNRGPAAFRIHVSRQPRRCWAAE